MIARSDDLGASFPVINREGANGALAAAEVAKATPDGSKIVYRAVPAGGIRADTRDEETGVFVVETSGGQPQKVRDGGADPLRGAAKPPSTPPG